LDLVAEARKLHARLEDGAPEGVEAVVQLALEGVAGLAVGTPLGHALLERALALAPLAAERGPDLWVLLLLEAQLQRAQAPPLFMHRPLGALAGGLELVELPPLGPVALEHGQLVVHLLDDHRRAPAAGLLGAQHVTVDVIAHVEDAVAVDAEGCVQGLDVAAEDRKSTRLNSSHVKISDALFCLKKKKVE